MPRVEFTGAISVGSAKFIIPRDRPLPPFMRKYEFKVRSVQYGTLVTLPRSQVMMIKRLIKGNQTLKKYWEKWLEEGKYTINYIAFKSRTHRPYWIVAYLPPGYTWCDVGSPRIAVPTKGLSHFEVRGVFVPTPIYITPSMSWKEYRAQIELRLGRKMNREEAKSYKQEWRRSQAVKIAVLFFLPGDPGLDEVRMVEQIQAGIHGGTMLLQKAAEQIARGEVLAPIATSAAELIKQQEAQMHAQQDAMLGITIERMGLREDLAKRAQVFEAPGLPRHPLAPGALPPVALPSPAPRAISMPSPKIIPFVVFLVGAVLSMLGFLDYYAGTQATPPTYSRFALLFAGLLTFIVGAFWWWWSGRAEREAQIVPQPKLPERPLQGRGKGPKPAEALPEHERGGEEST